MRQKARVACLAVAMTVLAACGSMSENPEQYPEGDLTFIVPYGTGGSTDPVARQFAGQLEELLGVTVAVENREGGSATIGTGAVVDADPDGYTIGLSSNSALANQPLLNPNLSYDSPDDYQALVKLADVPTVLAVRADAPWQTFEDLVADAEQNPGKIRVSTSGAKTVPDVAVLKLNQAAGVELTTVPFTGGGGEALAALLGGQVEVVSGYAPTLRGQVEAGKLRVLGVFYDRVYEAFPDAASIVEAGYDVKMPASYYVIAPKGLPGNVERTLTDAARKIVGSPEFEDFATTNGYVLEALTGDEIDQELTGYRQTFEELQ